MTKRQAELFPGLQSGKKYLSDYPLLVAEWHPTKNKNKFPEDFLHKSNKKIWWKCEYGHEWEAAIYSRVSGNGCPYCGHQLASPDNNLTVHYPELVSEWHPLKNNKSPDNYLPQSNLKVWWQCDRGHEWVSKVYNRTINGNGCPSCSKKKNKNEIRIYVELMSIFDDLFHRHKIEGVEADIFIPEINLAIEYDGKYWHRDKTEQDKLKTSFFSDRQIKLLRIREHPLPKLEDDDIIIPMGSFLTKETMNEIIKLSNVEGNKVTEYLEKSEFVAEETYLTYVEYFPSPFPENSLAEVNPELAKEWHPTKNNPLTPYNFTQSAKPKVWWQCDEGHEWKANIYSRNLGGHGCPVCTGKVASTENCMAVTHPDLAKLFHPTKNGNHSPENLKAGTGIKLWWICDKGHEWQRDGYSVKILKSEEKCPHCRNESPDSK